MENYQKRLTRSKSFFNMSRYVTNLQVNRWKYFLSQKIISLGLSPLICCIFAPQSLAEPQGNSTKQITSPNLEKIPVGQENDAPYILNSGDRVQLDFFNIEEYSGDYQILIDGTIVLPLIGKVSLKGLTLEQAAEAIKASYGSLLTNPLLVVTLVGPRPLKVGVVGEVTSPGAYEIKLLRENTTGSGAQGGGLKFPTLIDALELAEGISPAGDLRRIVIRRPQVFGPNKQIVVDLWDFFKQGNLQQNITLRDGDTIFVPAVKEINTVEVLERAKANFSADLNTSVSISIVGEVNRPGPYTIYPGEVRSKDQSNQLTFLNNRSRNDNILTELPTVTRAIKFAGGITPEANIRKIQIRRRNPDDSEQVLTVNLWKLLNTGELSEDALLQAGDSIIVPKAENIDLSEAAELARANFAPNKIQVFVVGEVVSPGSLTIPPNSSLTEALLASGSFDQNRANQTTVEFIRQNPNGTVLRKVMEVDFSQAINLDNNPTLQDRDVIVVSRSGYTKTSDSIVTGIKPWAVIIRAFSDLFRGIDDVRDVIDD